PDIEVIHAQNSQDGHDHKPSEEPPVPQFSEYPQDSDQNSKARHDSDHFGKGGEFPHFLGLGQGLHPNVVVQAIDVLNIEFLHPPDSIDMDVQPQGIGVLGSQQHDLPQGENIQSQHEKGAQ